MLHGNNDVVNERTKNNAAVVQVCSAKTRRLGANTTVRNALFLRVDGLLFVQVLRQNRPPITKTLHVRVYGFVARPNA
jgi:hypothetical protein